MELLNVRFFQQKHKYVKVPRSLILSSWVELLLGMEQRLLVPSLVGAIIADGVEIDGTDEVQVVGYNEVVGVATDEDW